MSDHDDMDDGFEDELPSFEKEAASTLSPEQREISDRALANAKEAGFTGGGIDV